MTDTLFVNAHVLTMDRGNPRASDVLVRDGVVLAAAGTELRSRAAERARVVDCGGGLLVPAFIDAHCHLLAAAAARRSIDCSPAAGVRGIGDIQRLLREAASAHPGDGWLRATGYDETQLAERRHPTRRDLDAAAGGRPVRLLHRSGHALVLNTRGMQLAGIANDTAEPPGGVIERSLDDGSPSGVLLEMSDVADRVVPPLPYEELAPAVAEVARDLLAAGVAAICDATHTNGASEWKVLARLQADGHLPLDVTMMEGIDHIGEMPEEATAQLQRGHVKIMPHELGGDVTPDEGELARIVADVHARGRDVAVHAVEERAVGAAIAAIRAAVAARPRGHRHRIEHAGVLPDGGAQAMAAAGITVVTQPAFLLAHGDRYLREMPHHRRDRLYAIGDLLRASVRVAASSDAPVGPLAPLEGVRAGCDRRTASGAVLRPAQAVSFEEALAMYTVAAAEACGMRGRGTIAAGARADLVLLSGDGPRARVAEVFRAGATVTATAG
jgi:predicted amidohydrolase YtcJ